MYLKLIKSLLIKYTPYLLIFAVLLYNLGLYFSHQILVMDKFFDSDTIYLPTLFKDLFVNGASYTDWYTSAAPYYFPDMFLYFISNFIFQDFYFAIPFYFTLISILVLISLFKIYRNFYTKLTSLYLSSIIFSIIYLIPNYIYNMQFVSVFHFGEFLITLFSLSLILNIINKNDTNKYYLYLLVLSSLTIASDNMYVLHFLLPTICTLLILWSFKIINHKKLIFTYLTLFGSLIFGKLINNALTFNISEYASNITLSYKHLTKNIQSLIEIFNKSYNDYFFYTIYTIFILLLLCVILILYKRVKFLNLYRYQTKGIYFIIYFFLMILGNILAVSFLYPNTIYEHYIVPVFLMPIFILPIVLKFLKFYLQKKLFFIINYFLCLILIFFIAFSSYTKFNNTSFKKEYYPKLVLCLDSFIKKTNAKDGISGFWESKSLAMLSKYDINIAQYNYDLTKFKAVNTLKTYKDYYDFAIIKNNSLDEKKLLKINGEPSFTYKCEEANILYYKNKLVIDNSYNLPQIQNKTISFDSKEVLYEGWSIPEKDFRWSLNNDAKILFSIDKKTLIKGELILNLNTLGKQRVLISINNQILINKDINAQNLTLKLNFNPNILNSKGNVLKFKLPTAHIPNDKDLRILAIAINNFIIN